MKRTASRPVPAAEAWRTGFKTAAAVSLFAVLHSALASLPAQQAFAIRLGARSRRGLYRPFYIAQSILSLLALGLYLHRLPDRTLYRASRPMGYGLRLGQALGLLYAAAAAWRVGLTRISGWASFSTWAAGAEIPAVEPAAQGPAPAASNRLQTGWPFSWSRHPLNFSPLPVFWLNPTMTVRLLAFNLVASLYLVLGSLHEERRLLARYGALYQRYQHSGVPFFLPRPRNRQNL
jgi:methanethiol S-methyltransferase